MKSDQEIAALLVKLKLEKDKVLAMAAIPYFNLAQSRIRKTTKLAEEIKDKMDGIYVPPKKKMRRDEI